MAKAYTIKPEYCDTCRIMMPVMDMVGMPKGGLIYVCKECGEIYCNDVAQEYLDGRLDGLDEFWMIGGGPNAKAG